MPEVRCLDEPTATKQKYVYVCMKYFRFFLFSGHLGVDLQRIATNIIRLVEEILNRCSLSAFVRSVTSLYHRVHNLFTIVVDLIGH